MGRHRRGDFGGGPQGEGPPPPNAPEGE
jgi:hypothetical protein